ncbi:MAG: pantetheine-phosphate adenylyltransferase [Ignavibacteria bacterium]|nr:pantetheine-phosphate adenylyltransferase [Ignavibacteria bacterium]MBI3766767.1 pantetheine-phosphate adenylyltransferase [Ignavibacteriales bacterium]
MKIALYPGTFDPITYGHIDVIERAREIFDKVIVTVAHNTSKQPMFTDEERVKMIREVVRKFNNVEVKCFGGLLVTFARKNHATAIVRGLRAVSDFEYEFQMALTNRKLADTITTVFLMPHEKYTYLNSSIVREIATFGGDISEFVPPSVRRHLMKKFKLTTSF